MIERHVVCDADQASANDWAIKEVEMIERHVVFDVLPAKTQEFEQFFVQEYRPGMASMPGYVKVELLREQESLTQYQMVIRFETGEAAAAWRASAAHQALSPRLKALYTTSQLKVYTVIA